MTGLHQVENALRPWGKFRVVRPLAGGHRNAAFVVENGENLWVCKTTRRDEAALNWLSGVHSAAEQAGFVVPALTPTPRGDFSDNGYTLEPYVEGTPLSASDLSAVLPLIGRFHALTPHVPQRPGFASAAELLSGSRGGDIDLSLMPLHLVHRCRSSWELFREKNVCAIHGDLNPTNILRTPGGGIALLDWDEARVDSPLFDIWQAGGAGEAEREILDAWEIAVCWSVEPEHAKAVAARLGWL